MSVSKYVRLSNPRKFGVRGKLKPLMQGRILKPLGAAADFIHDCHYAALLLENGLSRTATADLDFKKFDFLTVINPMV